MLSVSGIKHINKKQVKIETVSTAKDYVSQKLSDKGYECLSDIQKGLINTKQKLDKTSYYCKFFGVDSPANVQKQLQNQITLSWFKNREQNLVCFPMFSIDSMEDILHTQEHIGKNVHALKENGMGRWTFLGEGFGENGGKGTHTIGLVYDNGNLWILDSLPKTDPNVKKYHTLFKNILGEHVKDVKFSDKPQQSTDEFCCNNWTHANIDSVINYRKRGNNTPLNEKILNNILPNNINTVLEEQYKYIIKNLNGRDFFDIVTEKKYPNLL